MKGALPCVGKEREGGLTKAGARRPALPYRIATNTFQASTSKFSLYLLVAVSAVLLMVLVAVGAWWLKQRKMADRAGPRKTIAVPPLHKLNPRIPVAILPLPPAPETATRLTHPPPPRPPPAAR